VATRDCGTSTRRRRCVKDAIHGASARIVALGYCKVAETSIAWLMYLRGCIVGPETDVLVPLWICTLVRHIQEAVFGPKHVRRDRAIRRRASLATDGDTFSRTILKVNRALRRARNWSPRSIALHNIRIFTAHFFDLAI